MTVRVPRRFDLQSRPFKGLTVKQIVFLAFSGSVALLCVMTPFLGRRLWVRVLAAFVVLTVGLVLAFLTPGGMSLTEWGRTLARYGARPRLRVWRRTAPSVGGPLEEKPAREERPERVVPPPPVAVPQPAVARQPLVLSPLGLVFDLVLLFILYLMTWYMVSGGGEELMMFWRMLSE